MPLKLILFISLSFIALNKVNAQTSAIGNYVWYDTNRNGIQDPNEVGIGNVVVKLTKPSGAIEIISTDPNGKYLFNNLLAGTYSIEFVTPTGMLAATPNTTADSLDSDPIAGIVSNIVLADNIIDSTIDAGFANSCTGTITGNVWHDINGMDNGIIDSVGSYASVGIPSTGMKVGVVSHATGKVIKFGFISATTKFTITGIPPGSYYLILTKNFPLIGEYPPSATLYNPWFYTGEKVGTGLGRDLLINGKLNINVGYECVYVKFGIKINNYLCVCDGVD
jgi:SdrD B-like domain